MCCFDSEELKLLKLMRQKPEKYVKELFDIAFKKFKTNNSFN